MISYNGQLFASYHVQNHEVKVVCEKDENGNPKKTDVMPLLTKDKLTYLYNVNINRTSSVDGKDVTFTINGIELGQAYGSYELKNVLVKSMSVDRDCTFYISYNL